MFHKITVIGNLGHNPELRYSPEGKAVVTFSVATSIKKGGDKVTVWIRVTTWDKQAEICHKYLKKGSKVHVEGRFTNIAANGGPRTYERDNHTWVAQYEIAAQEVTFLDSKEAETPTPDLNESF